ncbi:hydroxymethylglutaryl-CoA lyase [Oceanobacillus manasiensis]|uniref:hydroxymethylglutaryl-CoA lyase n=1 Tax=Oceanobacillus manasiensis TaxID=586413 RepID=UPI0005AB1F6E|nr:hydroxymethylglutaryl-CoA lyase [Oceanobacillus manasiensis]
MNFPPEVTIKEVGPRDGLQNERTVVPLDAKVEWINLLSETGMSYIEISSFVRPEWIPQLKDATEVAKRIKRDPNVTYAALVPNQRGLERALEVDIDEVCVFISASETHNLKNVNKTIADTIPIIDKVANEAVQNRKQLRGYISTVFGCPYEGETSIDQVLFICDKLLEMGVQELSIGDTIGVADPLHVENVTKALLNHFPKDRIAMHFHDTRGTALANVITAMNLGISKFDSTVGGLGGCPYAKGASGNLATEDLLYMLHRMGVHTGINSEKVSEAATYISQHVPALSSHQMKLLNS